MSAKVGEVARETAVFRCEACHHQVTVKAGALIGECPHCGHDSFQTGWSKLLDQAQHARELEPAE